jgi:hypothetical protein
MFKIYYDDGTEYEGGIPRKMQDEKVRSLGQVGKSEIFSGHVPPFGGVVAIAQYMRETDIVDLLTGEKYYVWKQDHWLGGDLWHLLDFMETQMGVLKYTKNRMTVKEGDKWRNVDTTQLYAHLADSGLVVLGTMERNEFLLEAMQKIHADFAKIDIARFKLPIGTKLGTGGRTR